MSAGDSESGFRGSKRNVSFAVGLRLGEREPGRSLSVRLALASYIAVSWTNETMRGFPAMSAESRGDGDVLVVRDGLAIPRAELVLRATRAGGPGGQHVNTSSTRIELLWNVLHSAALTDEQRTLISSKLARRIDSEGWLRIVASDNRSQLRNRRAAEERLVAVVRDALHVAKKRRPTKPGASAREQRLREKKLHSRKKDERRARPDD
jgi:ribosome-associated protein